MDNWIPWTKYDKFEEAIDDLEAPSNDFQIIEDKMEEEEVMEIRLEDLYHTLDINEEEYLNLEYGEDSNEEHPHFCVTPFQMEEEVEDTEVNLEELLHPIDIKEKEKDTLILESQLDGNCKSDTIKKPFKDSCCLNTPIHMTEEFEDTEVRLKELQQAIDNIEKEEETLTLESQFNGKCKSETIRKPFKYSCFFNTPIHVAEKFEDTEVRLMELLHPIDNQEEEEDTITLESQIDGKCKSDTIRKPFKYSSFLNTVIHVTEESEDTEFKLKELQQAIDNIEKEEDTLTLESQFDGRCKSDTIRKPFKYSIYLNTPTHVTEEFEDTEVQLKELQHPIDNKENEEDTLILESQFDGRCKSDSIRKPFKYSVFLNTPTHVTEEFEDTEVQLKELRHPIDNKENEEDTLILESQFDGRCKSDTIRKPFKYSCYLNTPTHVTEEFEDTEVKLKELRHPIDNIEKEEDTVTIESQFDGRCTSDTIRKPFKYSCYLNTPTYVTEEFEDTEVQLKELHHPIDNKENEEDTFILESQLNEKCKSDTIRKPVKYSCFLNTPTHVTEEFEDTEVQLKELQHPIDNKENEEDTLSLESQFDDRCKLDTKKKPFKYSCFLNTPIHVTEEFEDKEVKLTELQQAIDDIETEEDTLTLESQFDGRCNSDTIKEPFEYPYFCDTPFQMVEESEDTEVNLEELLHPIDFKEKEKDTLILESQLDGKCKSDTFKTKYSCFLNTPTHVTEEFQDTEVKLTELRHPIDNKEREEDTLILESQFDGRSKSDTSRKPFKYSCFLNTPTHVTEEFKDTEDKLKELRYPIDNKENEEDTLYLEPQLDGRCKSDTVKKPFKYSCFLNTPIHVTEEFEDAEVKLKELRHPIDNIENEEDTLTLESQFDEKCKSDTIRIPFVSDIEEFEDTEVKLKELRHLIDNIENEEDTLTLESQFDGRCKSDTIKEPFEYSGFLNTPNHVTAGFEDTEIKLKELGHPINNKEREEDTLNLESQFDGRCKSDPIKKPFEYSGFLNTPIHVTAGFEDMEIKLNESRHPIDNKEKEEDTLILETQLDGRCKSDTFKKPLEYSGFLNTPIHVPAGFEDMEIKLKESRHPIDYKEKEEDSLILESQLDGRCKSDTFKKPLEYSGFLNTPIHVPAGFEDMEIKFQELGLPIDNKEKEEDTLTLESQLNGRCKSDTIQKAFEYSGFLNTPIHVTAGFENTEVKLEELRHPIDNKEREEDALTLESQFDGRCKSDTIQKTIEYPYFSNTPFQTEVEPESTVNFEELQQPIGIKEKEENTLNLKPRLYRKRKSKPIIKPFVCDICDYRSKYKATLKGHIIRNHLTEKTCVCKICGFQFVRKEHLERHLRTHSGEKPFMCEICGSQFGQQSSLKDHLSNHTGYKPFRCKICQYSYARRGQLQDHLKTHKSDKPFKCEFCNFNCASRSILKTHLQTHTGDKPFQCEICDYKSSRKGSLQRHFKVHTGEKSFECVICKCKIAQKANLIKHLRTHTGDKPFSCKICSFKCVDSNTLKIHSKTHTGEKPFKCELCDHRSARKEDLKIHFRKHTGERPYKCEICGDKFTLRGSLVHHLLSHTDGKPINVWNLRIQVFRKN